MDRYEYDYENTISFEFGANVYRAYLDPRLEYWSLYVTPYRVRCWELWSNL